jgi:hypothetical protein
MLGDGMAELFLELSDGGVEVGDLSDEGLDEQGIRLDERGISGQRRSGWR